MKTIVGLVVLVMSTFSIKAQSNHYHFVSNQQQQVKYDAENKLYFIDREFNAASEITIEKNIISFSDGVSRKYSTFINNINLESLANKTSFTLEGRDMLSGKPVKIGFWFIAGELDEVSYANDAFAHSITYKNISSSNDAISDALVAAGTSK